jgi:hypothetical protein
MIDLFSVFKVVEPQGNYMEKLYGPGEHKLTWMLCCYFSYIARLFYIYQTCIFCNSYKIHFRTTRNFFLWKRVSINKIIMRLVKLCMQKTNKTNCIVWHGIPVYAVVIAMDLLYGLALWSMHLCMGFGSNGFVTNDTAIQNGLPL